MTHKLNKYGLRQKDMDYMINLFSQFSEIEKVKVFGSRATGSFKDGSDIDLAILGKKLNSDIVKKIHYLLEEESPTLLWFDIINYNEINNENLKLEIDNFGKIIYSIK